MILNNSDNNSSSSSSRKTLLERLASLRLQSSPNKSSSNSVKAPESPHFIPRSTQNVSTKSKFYNYPAASKDSVSSINSSHGEIPSSPSIGRRRKLSAAPGTLNTNPSNPINPKAQPRSAESPIGISSPKYFPKQKVLEITEPIELNLSEEIHTERNHSAKEVVTGFIDSFTILNNFLIKSTNSATAKLHLQNLNTSFAALQMDLKAAVKTISQLQEELNLNPKSGENEAFKTEIDVLKSGNEALKSEIKLLKSENEDLKSETVTLKSENEKLKSGTLNSHELEEQLKIALSQISEIKIAYDKEKENVEFLQNYMEEVIQLKDESEHQILKLEKKISDLMSPESAPNDLKIENEKLKETIKLLDLERSSNKNVCKQALEVLDAASKVDVEKLQQELKNKQIEIEKLRGREQHFKESNEIFQQKLLILTEENRKLKGQRPLNHY